MRKLSLFLALCFLILETVGAETTTPIKLSAPFPSGGDVSTFIPNPSGTHIIYRADQEQDGVYELYRVPDDGGVPVKLNGPLVPGGDVYTRFFETPDGSRIVYNADQDIDGSSELYSVPVGGGNPTKLNDSLANGGRVWTGDFVVSSDSLWVVYRGRNSTATYDELYSVPVNGGTVIRLDDPALPTDGIANGPLITPDSQRVIYNVRSNNSVFDIYSVPIGGGISTKLNGSLVSGGRVFDYEITPDGARVIYTAEQDTDGVLELYSVPVMGGAPVKLNGSLVSGGEVTSDFQISADSSRVVYLADQDIVGTYELYSVPTGGGYATKLNGALVSGGGVSNVSRAKHFQISSDSARVVYLADQDVDEVVELFSVAIEGGATTKLNGPLVAGGDVDSLFEITSDGSRVVYRADQDLDDTKEIYSVPLTGGASSKLNEALASGDVTNFIVMQDNSSVIYIAEQDSAGVSEIYRVPIIGGFPVKLNGTPVVGGNVNRGLISSDEDRLIYVADEQVDEVLEMYSVSLGFDDYDTFAQFHGLITSYDEDEELDGNSNVFEYLGAGNPNEFDTPLRLNVTRIDGLDEFSFVLASTVGSGMRLEVEASTDLTEVGAGGWTSIAVHENGVWTGVDVEMTRIGEGLVKNTLRLESSNLRFYRLRATPMP